MAALVAALSSSLGAPCALWWEDRGDCAGAPFRLFTLIDEEAHWLQPDKVHARLAARLKSGEVWTYAQGQASWIKGLPRGKTAALIWNDPQARVIRYPGNVAEKLLRDSQDNGPMALR